MVDLERRWAAHGFARVHRKFMVNLRQAVALRRYPSGNATVAFADESEVPIARRNVAELRRRLSP
jgi:DNA-binding LytR/AlgR family response regulator